MKDTFLQNPILFSPHLNKTTSLPQGAMTKMSIPANSFWYFLGVYNIG